MIFKSLYPRDFDISLNWDTLTLCQYKCPYCYARAEKSTWGKIQTFNEISHIIDNIEGCPFSFKICLLGGEPTLHPDLKYFLTRLNNLKNVRHIELFTNFKKQIPEFINLLEKVTVIFSYHITENPDETLFLKRVKNIKNFKLFLMIPQSEEFLKKANLIYNKLKTFNPLCHYITTHNKTISKYHFENETEDKFCLNDEIISISEVLNSKMNCFKGWQCLRNDYNLSVDGTVSNMCLPAVGNIFKGFNFNDITLDPVICNFETCSNSCWLETGKFNARLPKS